MHLDPRHSSSPVLDPHTATISAINLALTDSSYKQSLNSVPNLHPDPTYPEPYPPSEPKHQPSWPANAITLPSNSPSVQPFLSSATAASILFLDFCGHPLTGLPFYSSLLAPIPYSLFPTQQPEGSC
ncbi:hypothetical protein D623_10004402 [Myotis brandtii]|uniref:Uncharacterized protein n=1 Tax=Myotis brandtii TaxID=109478 RepID=S7MP58_MYOBR|nr:hypothetical protein D623_10004402 [Myotis brandtii]